MTIDVLAQDITEQIKKNLPAQLSEVLQQELKEGREAKAELIKSKENNASLNRERENLRRDILNLEISLKAAGDMKAREDAVAKREQAAELEALKVQLNAANASTQFVKEVALGLVRNTEFRENNFRSTNTPVMIPSPGGGYVQDYKANINDTSSKTAV